MNFMNFQTFYSLSSNPHSLQYLREQFFLADLRRFKNADLRWYSLRLSARVHFCDICENYSFSLIYADIKTQIYVDYQLITNKLVLTTDNWNSITHHPSPILYATF